MLKKHVKQLRYLGPDPEPAAAPDKVAQEKAEQARIDVIVQKRLAEEKAKHNKELQTQLERINALTADAEEKEKLKQRLDELEKQGLTEKELAERERKKAIAELDAKRQKAEEDAKKWRTTYETEKLERDLMDVAASKETDAYNAQQLKTYLKTTARLVPKTDATTGKETGELEVKVRYNGTKDNRPIELDGTPAEVVKLMREDPAHGNFFKAGVVSGLGGVQTNPTRAGGGGKLSLSTEEFNKRYAKGTLPKD